MLHEEPVQYDRPDCADAGSGEWTGEKRRRHLDTSLHSEVRTSSSDSPPAEGDQEDPFFTTLDLEKVTLTFGEVESIIASMRDRPSISAVLSPILEDEPQRRVYERLMVFRLRAHQLSKGEPLDKLDDETMRKELPTFLVEEKDIGEVHFQMKNHLTVTASLDWYFDPEFSRLQTLGDYQRLVLKNHDDEFLNWEVYRSTFTTYKMDEDYVLFFHEMSQKLQWLKRSIKYIQTREWAMTTELRGAHQALKIAREFKSVTVKLAYIAYEEHLWNLHYDYMYCDGWDAVFFEIWKLVTRDKMEFKSAVMKVKEMHMFDQHDLSIARFLRKRRYFDLKSKYDSCVEHVPLGAEDVVAIEVIKKAVPKLPRKKLLHQYMMKKMSIAKEIGLNDGF